MRQNKREDARPRGKVDRCLLAPLMVLALAGVACVPAEDEPDPSGPSEPSAQELRCTQEFGEPAESPYILPYKVEGTYTIIQSYCPSNPAWGHHGWLAYDFDTAIGDTVVASRGGEVLFVQESYADNTGDCSRNNWVFIQHDDRTVMQYVHIMQRGALVSVGERVEQGQPIALSGNSGCSSGPHLHVALFRDRTGFDAEDTLPLNYRNARGPLDPRNGLMFERAYSALPWQ